jgi:DnaJ homolog subfamily C member 19
LIAVLLAGIVFAALSGQRSGGSGARRVRRGSFSPLWLLGAVLVGLVLFRFGMHWLAVVGGMLLAATRTLLPLLRFLPMLRGFRSGASAGSAHSERPSSKGQANGTGGRKPARMSRHEALQVLGLDGNATDDDVRREYRRLMKKLHPDLGGSGYLAAKINEAKDVLL